MPFCTFCGSSVEADSSFCSSCGKPLTTTTGARAAGGTPSHSPVSREVKPAYGPPVPKGSVPSYQEPWTGALILQSGEAVEKHWPADNEISQMGVVNGQRQRIKVRIRGVLVLTNQRIVFIKERGVFGKSYHIDFSVPLEGLSGLSLGGLVMKYVSLSDSGGEKVMHIRGVGNDLEFSDFRSLVQEQVGNRQKAIESAKRRERVQIVLDFGFLKDYMSKGGLSMQVVKCPQCGAPMSLPSEGSQVKCAHCGSTIFAQDIMEKVKELIG